MNSNFSIPWFIGILILLNFLAGIGLIIFSFLGFIGGSFITSLLLVAFGLISLYVAYGLKNAEKWSYYYLLLGFATEIVSYLVYSWIMDLFSLEGILAIIASILVLIYLVSSKDIKGFFGFERSAKTSFLFKKSMDFLNEDSYQSLLVALLLILAVIKFSFIPILSLLTGSPLPLVIVESCSMYHSTNLEGVMQDKIYADYNLSYEDTNNWVLRHGFSKGDIIFIVGKKNVEIGDVIVFDAGQRNPIIHRVIAINNGSYTTKGDHNHGFLPYEKSILDEQVFGKAVFRIPFIGWVKLFFFDILKPASERGFCK